MKNFERIFSQNEIFSTDGGQRISGFAIGQIFANFDNFLKLDKHRVIFEQWRRISLTPFLKFELSKQNNSKQWSMKISKFSNKNDYTDTPRGDGSI